VEKLAAVPVFYPITPAGEPDMNFLSALDGSPVRAILVAHLFGLPTALEAVTAFCRSRGIALIEDCAHCFFGTAGHMPVGLTGDFAVGSLPKFFPVIEGGLLASASRTIDVAGLPPNSFTREARAVWDLVDLSSRAHRLGLLGSAARTVSRARGFASHSASLADTVDVAQSCAAIREVSLADPLLEPARLSRVESWVIENSDAAANAQQRQTNYGDLAAGLTDLPGARLVRRDCGPQAAPYAMPLLVREPDEPYLRMRRMGLPVFRWDRIWPGTPSIPGDAATIWARGVIQIACHQSLRTREIDALVAAIRKCLQPVT